MNIIRASGDMAKEFLEQLIEEFELELATSGTIDPHDEYAGHYHGLDADRDAYIEGIQSESYSGIYRELDSFLLSKGLNVKKGSAGYMALARRFMQAKIKALAIMMEICQGKSYNYTNKQSASTDTTDGYPQSVTKWKTARSQNLQIIINNKAKDIMSAKPETGTTVLAGKVYDTLPEKHQKRISIKTIYRNYLDDFKNR